MAISKNHRFGLIVFFVLLIVAYLVTIEPWKKSSGDKHSLEESVIEKNVGDTLWFE